MRVRQNIYDVLKIEKRRDGTFWVLDKRGANVVVVRLRRGGRVD